MPTAQCDTPPITLLDYFALTNDVARALAAVENALAESPDALELLAARLAKACEELSSAKCRSAGGSDLREAARLIEKGRRLVFAVKVTGARGEFPKLLL